MNIQKFDLLILNQYKTINIKHQITMINSNVCCVKPFYKNGSKSSLFTPNKKMITITELRQKYDHQNKLKNDTKIKKMCDLYKIPYHHVKYDEYGIEKIDDIDRQIMKDALLYKAFYSKCWPDAQYLIDNGAGMSIDDVKDLIQRLIFDDYISYYCIKMLFDILHKYDEKIDLPQERLSIALYRALNTMNLAMARFMIEIGAKLDDSQKNLLINQFYSLIESQFQQEIHCVSFINFYIDAAKVMILADITFDNVKIDAFIEQSKNKKYDSNVINGFNYLKNQNENSSKII